ncbi:prolyl-tRNA synthetase [Lojkania enalia]|uniref:proline--tRNA ligase n=1 Tax=Lojkania enalia TaxID=147567 RepID=A0A9P4N613_9PLEO|nr:prolyl-tRNA synthetase [Didymosphaeria enalia]
MESSTASSKLSCKNYRECQVYSPDDGNQIDSRNRLSKFWTPTGGISPQDGKQDDSHNLLIRAGFLRQAYSGVFHLLPLGLRVQEKLEILIDKHMRYIGASKLSLSSISNEALWQQSGRYSTNSELLRLNDRRESGFLLSPTHEEEITRLISSIVHSHNDLPLRLYQIGRKYRDEKRPRQGLLRAKEFLMKDLYTFDYSQIRALNTYNAVRKAYNNLFDELKVPYLVADADSGNMGGKLSHEYHFVSEKGEDNVWSCNKCEYVANEELVEKKVEEQIPTTSPSGELVFAGISTDRTTTIHIAIPRPQSLPSSKDPTWEDIHKHVNLHAVKRTGIDLDTGIESSALSHLLSETTKTIHIRDRRLVKSTSSTTPEASSSLDLTVTRPGDFCPRCSSGKLYVQKAIEVGHTFHLGTRYSEPLNALITVPESPSRAPIQMGCHGIGVSRLIGAVASLLADSRGLNWPRCIAPYECIIAPTPDLPGKDAEEVYDRIIGRDIDVVLDDRAKGIGWKLKDADLIGYPVIIVLGQTWKHKNMVEVQCRRLRVKVEVKLTELRDTVLRLLEQL